MFPVCWTLHLEGFELEVLDYLLKPISFERFIKAINRFPRKPEVGKEPATYLDKPDEFLYVKSERKTLKLLRQNVSFIEGLSNYIIVHVDGNQHIVYTSLNEILKELDHNFLRIHKSYIINKKMIKSYSKEVVCLENRELPIGKSYKQVIEDF